MSQALVIIGAPGRIRTHDPLVRSPILARGDPVLSMTYSGFPLQWLLDDA